jgi:DNA-binding CsgD family transcriptional regulator
MFVIRREQGRLHEVASILRTAVQLDTTGTVWRPGLAALFVELGMLDEAGTEFAALAPGGFVTVPRDSMWPCCLALLAEVCVALADGQHAEFLYHELEPFRGHTLMAAHTINFGPAERLMGSLAALLGRRDDAEGHFRSALELAEQSDSPLWRAQTQYEWAAAFGDRADLMAMAHTTAVQFGLHRLADRTLLHIPDIPASAQDFPDGLSGREAEVLALVATGRSNRAIGDLLFISPNTVANHVRSILQKTGCANRADAAAYATRRGLAR